MSDENLMPLFYENPVPLDPEQHANVSFKKTDDMSFAAHTNSIPLTTHEFVAAALDYPVVFNSNSEKPVPFALVGARDTENLFINEEGKWLKNTYIPQYVHRYPFIFMESKSDERLVLCVDETAKMLSEGDENPFFKGTEPTELSNKALEFCSDYHRQIMATDAFMEALKAEDLLTSHYVEFKMNSGEKLTLSGFDIIDEKKFRALKGKTLNEWHEKGWTLLASAHLISMGNWHKILNLIGERGKVKEQEK